jgi:hypothetical protein
VTGSVIGADATFTQPVRLRNSLVLAGTRFAAPGDHDHVIAHGDSLVQCQDLDSA